ncbi:hypothetical protein GCM10010424_36130 [Streptomyces lienomycini]
MVGKGKAEGPSKDRGVVGVVVVGVLPRTVGSAGTGMTRVPHGRSVRVGSMIAAGHPVGHPRADRGVDDTPVAGAGPSDLPQRS